MKAKKINETQSGRINIRQDISSLVSSGDFNTLVGLLRGISTEHAGTAKTEFKRYALNEILRQYKINGQDNPRRFFAVGKKLCEMKDDNAKEIGVSLIWRGFSHSRDAVLKIMKKIGDDKNWEVREYAASAFIELLKSEPSLHEHMLELTGHSSENIRRAVLFSSLAYKNDKVPAKGLEIISRLMEDSSVYVKRNLGPFILGSHFGNRFPEETLEYLKQWSDSENKNALWNVAMSFKNSFGNKYYAEALEVLHALVLKRRDRCLPAVISTLRHLSVNQAEAVTIFCRRHELEIKRPSKSKAR